MRRRAPCASSRRSTAPCQAQEALEAALAAYGRAAEYGVARSRPPPGSRWRTFTVDFGRALLDSERPGSLSADELEQYDLLLEEQAFPFEEKAIDLHERNARRAAEGVYDEWVQQSYAALAELKPGRWARAEREGAPTDEPARQRRRALPLARASPAVADPRAASQQRQAGRFEDARAAYERPSR